MAVPTEDPHGEFLECLDVLMEFADGDEVEADVLSVACVQAAELGVGLLMEYGRLLDEMRVRNRKEGSGVEVPRIITP